MEDKPIIISIETSGTTCGVALSEAVSIVADYSIFGKNLHDRLNAEFIRRIIADNSLTIEDIDCVAVSAGPGSFTGLRIGGSIAKGLCFGDKPRFIAVPTLGAFAFAATGLARVTGAKGIIAAIAGHKNFIYYQEFTAEGDEQKPPEVIEAEQFISFDLAEKVICGTAAGLIDAAVTLPELQILSAKHIAKLAYKLHLEDRFSAAQDFEPMYIMDFKPKIKNILV